MLHFKNVPPLVILSPLQRNLGDGPDCGERYCNLLGEI